MQLLILYSLFYYESGENVLVLDLQNYNPTRFFKTIAATTRQLLNTSLVFLYHCIWPSQYVYLCEPFTHISQLWSHIVRGVTRQSA
jgi:hypothetical protein